MASSSSSSSNTRSSSSGAWVCIVLVALLLVPTLSADKEPEGEAPSSTTSHVLTLDASNFLETVAKHSFIVVEFYSPRCGYCKELEPEYEKAAAALSKHDPPIVFAKVNAEDETNKELASKYEVNNYPTIKILRNKGETVQEYNGPQEGADDIVEFLKKQSGPASVVIKSAEDASSIIGSDKVFIVGVFAEFSGKEFDNFIAVAEKLRSDYDFGHTLEAKFLPKGKSTVSVPVVRLLKPFDELFVDSKDFNLDSLENFVEEASTPVVTVFNSDSNNSPFVMKFFSNEKKTKAMLFVDFKGEKFDEFKTEYSKAAELYKGKDISFLLGDVEVGQGDLEFFGLKEDQAPLIAIQTMDGRKYAKANLEPLEITAWLNEYMDGNLKRFYKSEPIPEVNEGPVKVVVADSIRDVLNSGKNVFLEFEAPSCGFSEELSPILVEVALSFEGHPDVIIAKMDATENDIPEEFNVEGVPTMFFSSASGKVMEYEGERTKEEIIDFIQKNRDVIKEAVQADSLKDEL